MSWHFSRALVADFLEADFWDGERYVLWNSISTAETCCVNGKTIKSSKPSQYGMTFVPSEDNLGKTLLTWFQAGFPVRTLASQALRINYSKDSRANAVDCGSNSKELFAKLNRRSCGWKMFSLSGVTGCQLSSGTWPRSGTLRNGVCFQRKNLKPAIKENVSSFWHITPSTRDFKGASRNCHSLKNFPGWLWVNFSLGKNMIYPNPSVSEQVMGWPIGWTDLKPLATDRFQLWLKRHGARSDNEFWRK